MPPYGNPFGNVLSILISTSTENLKNLALNIIEKMVKNGVNMSSRCLGTNYVLCAFTLVNSNAKRNTAMAISISSVKKYMAFYL